MSVYIKGMEMPKKKNGAVLIIYPDGKCAFEDGKTYQAVPVPPHGDLIERDAVEYDWDEDNQTWGYDIYSAPVIIPADPPVMYYPQVPGITPTVISDKEGER